MGGALHTAVTAVREERGRKAGEAPIFRILQEGGPDLDLENQVGVTLLFIEHLLFSVRVGMMSLDYFMGN